MSHFCAFCQAEHSSSSCFHPGHARLKEAEFEVARLRAQLAATQELYDNGGITFATYQQIEIGGGTKVICRLCAKDSGRPHATDCAVGKFEAALSGTAEPKEPQ